MAHTLDTLRLDFHGLSIWLDGDSAEVLDTLARDFAWFRVEATAPDPDLHIEVHQERPDYDALPPLAQAFGTPRNICYRDETSTYVDYFGRGLLCHEREAGRVTITAEDADLAREIVYLFVLSSVGQHLDRRGLHRVHALGVRCGDTGVLLLLPSGGGKSTLALRLLREPDVWLLGEDTPLIDHDGKMWPFVLRLGIDPRRTDGVPARYLQTVRRMEFAPKTLVDVAAFRDRIGEPVPVRALLIGQRSLGREPSIDTIPRSAAVSPLLRYLVVGLGVYQGLEFLLERGPLDLARRGGAVTGRVQSSARLLARASTHRFLLGRSLDDNAAALLGFMRDLG